MSNRKLTNQKVYKVYKSNYSGNHCDAAPYNLETNWQNAGGKEEKMGGSHRVHQYDTQRSYTVEYYKEAIKLPYHIHPFMSSQYKPSCKPIPNNGRGNLLSTSKRPVLPQQQKMITPWYILSAKSTGK